MNRKTIAFLWIALLMPIALQIILYLRTLDELQRISTQVSAYQWEVGRTHARFDRLERLALPASGNKVNPKP
jgi:hypothetical protein